MQEVLHGLGQAGHFAAQVPGQALSGYATLEAARRGILPGTLGLQRQALEAQLAAGQRAGIIQRAAALEDQGVRQYLTLHPEAAGQFGLSTVGGEEGPGTVLPPLATPAGQVNEAENQMLADPVTRAYFMRRKMNFPLTLAESLDNIIGAGNVPGQTLPVAGGDIVRASPAHPAYGDVGNYIRSLVGEGATGRLDPQRGMSIQFGYPPAPISSPTGTRIAPTKIDGRTQLITPPTSEFAQAQAEASGAGGEGSTEKTANIVGKARANIALQAGTAETRANIAALRKELDPNDPELASAINNLLPAGGRGQTGGLGARIGGVFSQQYTFPNALAAGDPQAARLQRVKNTIIPTIRAVAVTAKNLRITFPEIKLVGRAEELATGRMTAPEAMSFLQQLQENFDTVDQAIAEQIGEKPPPTTSTTRQATGGPRTTTNTIRSTTLSPEDFLGLTTGPARR